MKYLFLSVLPKNLISKFIGKLTDLNLPPATLHKIIKYYASFYRINLEDMQQPLGDIKTFGEFFARALKEGKRPFDPAANVVISPVDGTITEYGTIQDGLLMQAKKVFYSLSDLIGQKKATHYQNGFYLTIYLNPGDYHRIHAPFTGDVKEFSYFTGDLWPVNAFGVKKVPGLFSLNERIVTFLESSQNQLALVKVGAMVVGKITTSYTSLCSNQQRKTIENIQLSSPYSFAKGEELAQFQMGSTVILIFPPNQFKPADLFFQQKVKMGQTIGYLNENL